MTAGFHKASEFAKATKYLLEAHLYLNMANKEKNQEKKTHVYSTVERLLRSSADSFGESGYTAKSRNVMRLFDRVREERELAISLRADIASPLAMPSGIIAPSISSKENADLEKYQGAFVVANVSSSPPSPMLGESMSLKIELANAGMNAAQLLRVEKAVPEGFELVEKPKELFIEQQHIILKGRRLGPLKTEEFSLVLKPRVEGSLALEPRVLYLDENGKGRVHQPDPVRILVQDHGTVNRVAAEDVLEASPIMKFLANAFVEDYMRRRLSLEHAGWRGLPDIVRSLKVPRSQIYGDARYRHTFGKPLERLVKKGIVEFRIFPGSRGRGGNVVRVRVSYEKEPVKRLVDRIAL